MLVQRQIVSATVHAALNEARVSGTGTSYAPAASRNREICNAWVEVGQPIKALRPGTRQVVSKPQVRRQLVSYLPGVPNIESPIVLLASNRARDIYGARCLVAQGGANAKAIAQNEVGKILPGPRRPKTLRKILSPETSKGNKSSSGFCEGSWDAWDREGFCRLHSGLWPWHWLPPGQPNIGRRKYLWPGCWQAILSGFLCWGHLEGNSQADGEPGASIRPAGSLVGAL